MNRIVVTDTEIYQSFALYSAPSDIIKSGIMIELGNVIKDDGKEWIEVLSGNHVIGYIKGETLLLDPDKYCYIAQEFVHAYESPDLNSHPVRTYKKNEEIFLIDKINDMKTWYKVFDIQGNTGYIAGDTYLKSTNVAGQKMILSEDRVNLYQTYDTESPVLLSIDSGTQITLLSIEKDPWRNRWFHIETSQGNGYIKGNTEMFSMDEYAQIPTGLRNTSARNTNPSEYHKWFYVGSFALILVAMVWLTAGYFVSSRIYYYPFILIGISFIAIIRHFVSSAGNKKHS